MMPTKATKERMNTPILQFKTAQMELLETINQFPKEKSGECCFGLWNLKDIIAHFSAWNWFFTNCFNLLQTGKDIPYWGNINEFNKVEVEKRKNWSWEKTYAELIESGEAFIQAYTALPNKLLDKPFWKGKKYTPLKLLHINIHHYQKAQLVEINRLMKKWHIKI